MKSVLKHAAPVVVAILMAPVILGAQGEEATEVSDPADEVKPTGNPTGLQIGVAESAPKFPEGSEKLAQEAAIAAADRDWDEARNLYLEILEMDPENALTLSNLGATEYRARNYDKAIEYLEASTRHAPSLAQNWLMLGLIHHREGHSYLAISALSRALHEDPGDPRAHNYLAIVIREQGWVIGAETELQRAIVLDPGYADAHFNLAIMYLRKTPPAIALARRHYQTARDYGAAPDPTVEAQLRPAGSADDDENDSETSTGTESNDESEADQ